MEINKIIIAIFFLYFILMMDDIRIILNCNLQRYLKKTLWLKHVIIFFSIYIFTFILNWYSYDSLVVDNFDENQDKSVIIFNKINHSLIKYLVYTIIIYIIFIISTKNEGPFIATFIIILCYLTMLQVYIKSLNPHIGKDISHHFYIGNNIKNSLKEKYDDSNIDIIIKLHNLSIVLFIITLIILLIGMYVYYKGQSSEHILDWSWIIFIFGNNRCAS